MMVPSALLEIGRQDRVDVEHSRSSVSELRMTVRAVSTGPAGRRVQIKREPVRRLQMVKHHRVRNLVGLDQGGAEVADEIEQRVWTRCSSVDFGRD